MEKKIWMGLTVLVLLLIGTSFAWWYWNSTTNTNISLTINGVDVTYVGGSDITGVNLIPVSSKEKGIADNTAIEKVVTASSNSTTYMNLYLTLETLPNGLKDKSFVYEVYNGANLVGKGNFASYEQGEKAQIASAQKITSSTKSFQIYIWIDGNVDNSKSMMNKTFKFVLSADASEQDPAEQTLTKLGVDVNNTISEEVIDFSKVPYMTKEQAEEILTISCPIFQETENVTTCLSESFGLSSVDAWINKYTSKVDDNGIIESVDDLGKSYYYRGNVENNYVYFANAYWRIVRINGDGTVRMIYDGPTKKHNGAMGTDNIAFISKFNEENNDNAYVGYMYGTPLSDYTNTHKNTINSTIKTNLDKWYEDNIIADGYDKYVADAIYCNDRKVVTGNYWDEEFAGDGTGKNKTAYAAFKRYNDKKASLICEQDNDKFSITDIGNGDLTYPVALLTVDEAVMGGIVIQDDTDNDLFENIYSYLSMGGSYWTMSPFYYVDGSSESYVAQGLIASYSLNEFFGVRPVVSLKSDLIILSGDGSYDTPFEIGEGKLIPV